MSSGWIGRPDKRPPAPPPWEAALMFTNITENHRRAFEALTKCLVIIRKTESYFSPNE